MMQRKKLTPEQSDSVVGIMPLARAIARRFGPDDELVSEAYLAACEAVRDFEAARGSLRRWVALRVSRRLHRLRERTRRTVPLPVVAVVDRREPWMEAAVREEVLRAGS